MNKKAYKWLAVTLLLSVSIFSFLYLTKIQTSDGGQAVADVDVSEAEPAAPVQPEIPVKKIFYNTLPRAAKNADGFTIQNVGGSGDDVLKSVHSVGGKTVLFFETNSNGYDVKSEKLSVSAAMLDKNLTLEKTATMNGSGDEKFAAVKQTAKGFTLVSSSADYAAVYTLDFNLVTTGRVTTEAADGFYLFYTAKALFLFCENKDCLQIKVLSDNLTSSKTATLFVKEAKIINVFQSGDALNVFAETADGYALLRYSEDGGFSSVNEISSYRLLSVLPYYTDNGTSFAGLRKNGDVVSLFTANADFGVVNEVKTDYSSEAELFCVDKNLCLYGEKDGKGCVSVFCKHLDKIIGTETVQCGKIVYRNYSTSPFIVGYLRGTLTSYTFDGLYMTAGAVYNGCDGFCAPLYDGTFAFTSTYKGGAYGGNYGAYDVFVVKKD